MIRSILSVTAAAVLMVGAVAIPPAVAQTPAPAAADLGTLNVHLRGLTANKGSVVVLLFDSETAYDASKSAQSTKVDATAAAMDVSFSNVSPGRYAIKVFYDFNGNGQYEQGTDSIGFSNHVDMSETSHVPTYSETSFMVKAGVNTQQITVSRVRS
jgi:uncharacterized protein (DUF2141 family)